MSLDIALPGTKGGTKSHSIYKNSLNQFWLDAVSMLMQRDVLVANTWVAYWLADASQHGEFEFMMWKEVRIFTSDLLKATKALATLCKSKGACLHDEEDFETPLVDQDRVDANRYLASVFHAHLYVSRWQI